MHVFLRFVDRSNGISQRRIGCKIERYRDRRKLPLVINGERFCRFFKMRESAQRYGTAYGRTGGACRGGSPAGRGRGGARRKRVQRRSKSICRRSVQRRSRQPIGPCGG